MIIISIDLEACILKVVVAIIKYLFNYLFV